jgi:hypothetical protein
VSSGRSLLLTAAFVLGAACSSKDVEPLVEYPPLGGPEEEDGGSSGGPRLGPRDAGPDAPEPIVGKKILEGSIFLRGNTTDGHLVFDHGVDLSVLPDGEATPVVVVKDFDVGYDSMVIRGRFVAAWLGEDPGARPLTLWSKAGGVQAAAVALVQRESFYPKTAADKFAYGAPTTSPLRRDIWATKVGGGAGTKILGGLETGALDAQCRAAITYVGSDLLIGGCTNGSTVPKIALYAVDGSGASKTILDGAAPGIFINRARTHAIVQTATASSIRPLAGVGATVALDGPIRQAVFAADDTKVVYLAAEGKVKRASTSSPASPVEIGTAISILAVSPDTRFTVVATKGDPSKYDSDIVVLDANAIGSPTTIAAQKGAFLGMSKTGAEIVWIAERGIAIEGPLFVGKLGGAAPQKISESAERVETDGTALYFQEFDKDKKTNVLRAAKLASPANVLKIDEGLDPFTARALIVNKKVFVGSKVGLWQYPLLP